MTSIIAPDNPLGIKAIDSEELHTLLGETVAHQALADAEVVVKAVRRSFEGQIKK